MMVIHFDKMSVRVPMKDGDTIEDIEDKLIEAVDSIGDGVVMSFVTVIEDCNESEER